jgi:hypothetical protein
MPRVKAYSWSLKTINRESLLLLILLTFFQLPGSPVLLRQIYVLLIIGTG